MYVAVLILEMDKRGCAMINSSMDKQISPDVGFSYCKWYSVCLEGNESIAYSLAHL